jgi:16S rRNA (guanine1207-N2)-methyltransferase
MLLKIGPAMNENAALDTLFLPFDEGSLEWANDSLFLYADWHPSLKSPCDVLHIYKPAADRLEARGFNNLAHLERSAYKNVLIHAPKQVQEAQGLIALGVDRLQDGGTLVVAAENDANGKRLKNWLIEAGITVINEESKNKARVVWGVKPTGLAPLTQWLAGMSVRPVNGYYTRPGLFSWDSIDVASQLLVDHLPALSGNVADFGCGWGFLSCEILKRTGNAISTLLMIDADSRAIACAQANTEDVTGSVRLIPVWYDLTKNLPENVPALDYIVMNPPFHTGKKTDLDLGLSMIGTAAHSLKIGGTLYMVANAHLRYEEALGKLFKDVETIIQKNGFKVIRCKK